MKHFLDESATAENETKEMNAEQKWKHQETLKVKYSDWPIKYAESCVEDMDKAFSFFDALSKGVEKAPSKDGEKELWQKAESYLAERRLSP